jgi:hypothetical protein
MVTIFVTHVFYRMSSTNKNRRGKKMGSKTNEFPKKLQSTTEAEKDFWSAIRFWAFVLITTALSWIF